MTCRNVETLWASFPLVALMVRVYVPIGIVAGVDIVSVEVPVPVSRETLFGLIARVTFTVLGESEAFRSTLPAKLFKLFSETVNVASPP